MLIDEHGTILAGHGRVEAARLLGRSEVPTLRIEGMSEAEKRAYVIADNRIAENAGWNRQVLAAELGVLSDLLVEIDLDVTITGFEPGEVDGMRADFTPEPPDAADEVGQGAGLLEKRSWDGLSGRVMVAWYSASRSSRTAAI